MQTVFQERATFLSTFVTDDFGNEGRIVTQIDVDDIKNTQFLVSRATFLMAVWFSMEGLS
jgi:hypothetical protein